MEMKEHIGQIVEQLALEFKAECIDKPVGIQQKEILFAVLHGVKVMLHLEFMVMPEHTTPSKEPNKK